MNESTQLPTLKQIADFLDNYGWTYRETTAGENNDTRIIITNYRLQDNRGVLVSLRPEQEFVMVSTVDLLKNVPLNFSPILLEINDVIKLVKLYAVDSSNDKKIDVEVGFELWGKAWNKNTFAAFMDMLCLGIEHTLMVASQENIPHETQFVEYK